MNREGGNSTKPRNSNKIRRSVKMISPPIHGSSVLRASPRPINADLYTAAPISSKFSTRLLPRPDTQPTNQPRLEGVHRAVYHPRAEARGNKLHARRPASLLPLSGPLNRPWNLWSRNLSLDCAPRDALKDKIQRGRGNYKEKIITHIFHYFNRRFSCVYNL